MVSKKLPHWIVIMTMMMTMMIMIMIMPATISELIYRKCGVNRAPKKTTIRFAFITEVMRNFPTFQRSPPSYGTRRTCRGQLRTQRAETRQKRHLNNTAASEVYYQWIILVLTNKPRRMQYVRGIFLKNQLILCKDSVMIHGKSKIFFKLLNQLKLWKKILVSPSRTRKYRGQKVKTNALKMMEAQVLHQKHNDLHHFSEAQTAPSHSLCIPGHQEI